MKEYTTFEIIILWKRAKDDPFIFEYKKGRTLI